MKSALYIDADHALDRTGLLVSLPELIILKRAIGEVATLSMTQEEQRRVRGLGRQLDAAIETAKEAAETDHACLDRVLA